MGLVVFYIMRLFFIEEKIIPTESTVGGANNIVVPREHQVPRNLGEASDLFYKSKAANAQEAHEAIRPTAISRHPESMSSYLDDEQFKLYELIWKRTISSQMQSAELDETSADISNKDKTIVLRANGSQLRFPGFFIYRDRNDDKILPDLDENENVDLEKADGEQHFTQPPPRYTLSLIHL